MTGQKKSLGKSATELLLDSNGKRSGKRIITYAAFLLMAIGYIANLFWKKHVDADMERYMYYIVLFGVGAITAEPIAQKIGGLMQPPQGPGNNPPPPPIPPAQP